MQADPLESEADAMADAALLELGAIPLDLPDEYADLYEYAGCYPWLDGSVYLQMHHDGLSGIELGDESDSLLR